MDLLERLSQEEALLHVVVGGVGRVDVLHPGETAAHPTVLVNGLEGAQEREGGEDGVKTQKKKKREMTGKKDDEWEGQRVGDIFNRLLTAWCN